MITIVDYGLGNVQAIANIYKRLAIPAALARTAADLEGATHLILPGVGAFDWAMTRLNDSGMRGGLDELVTKRQRPVLGICVGMQMLARHSDEGTAAGLGWLDAGVKLFDHAQFTGRTHLPHMGWNDVQPVREDGLFAGLGTAARFYFLHSYYFAPNDPADVLASTEYGLRFACAVQRGNVLGVQFHPEKSHAWGIQLLKNFASL
ncbi:MAG: imidazole glycerol phosphate synthase subunit HisH [Rubrivivax sp.]|nr:imidazole glycerol phosphate synthase subunit HisH [Rubrivivax sp.]